MSSNFYKKNKKMFIFYNKKMFIFYKKLERKTLSNLHCFYKYFFVLKYLNINYSSLQSGQHK